MPEPVFIRLSGDDLADLRSDLREAGNTPVTLWFDPIDKAVKVKIESGAWARWSPPLGQVVES